MGNSLCAHALVDRPSPATNKQNNKQQHDAVAEALAAARKELDAGGQRRFADEWTTGLLLGHGAFSRVLACTHVSTGQQAAVKVVPRTMNLEQREAVAKEVAIMRLLAGHPASVTLLAVYVDEASYHLVMELCSGGELFDQIVRRRTYSEADAAAIMRQLLDFVAHAHSKHVVHRDLKPENLLLTSAGGDAGAARLRVVDFGTSEFCRPGQRLTAMFGTPYYVAPEVLSHSYGPPADVWSAGVVLYILLVGAPPFVGSNDARILQRVRAGAYSLSGREWEAVSEGAKDVVARMLVLDQDKRATAAALREHPWFKADLAAAAQRSRESAHAAALGAHIVRRLRGFSQLSHMKRLALKVMARELTDRDVGRLRALFMSMDKDDDGTISAEDLRQALEQVGAAIGDDEVEELFLTADLSSATRGFGDDDDYHDDGDGAAAAAGRAQQQQVQQQQHQASSRPAAAIDYEQFLAAMLDSARVAARADAVRGSFEALDRDGDGFISIQDLAAVLQEEAPALRKGPAGRRRSEALAAQLVAEVDAGHGGAVSYEDYERMWRLAASPEGGAAVSPAGAGASPNSVAPASPPPPPPPGVPTAAAAADAPRGAARV